MTACLLHVGQLLGADGAHQGAIAVFTGGNTHLVDEDDQGQALDACLHQGWTRYLIYHLLPTYCRIIFPNEKGCSERPFAFFTFSSLSYLFFSFTFPYS